MADPKSKAKGKRKPKTREALDAVVGAEKPKARKAIEATVAKMEQEGAVLAEMTGVPQAASYGDWTKELVKGAFEGVLKLDAEAAATVMKEVANKCRTMAEGLFQLDIRPGMDLDEAIAQIERSQFENLRIQRIGDNTIIWESSLEGKCPCPLLHEGLIKPNPVLCMCTTNWIKNLFQRVVQRPIEAELVQSIHTGAKSCIFRLNIKPSVYTSEVSEEEDKEWREMYKEGKR